MRFFLWRLRMFFKTMLSYGNAPKYLELNAINFDIEYRDWPPVYRVIGAEQTKPFSYRVKCTNFSGRGTGCGLTAFQAAVRAVTNMENNGRRFRKENPELFPTWEEVRALMGGHDNAEVSDDVQGRCTDRD